MCPAIATLTARLSLFLFGDQLITVEVLDKEAGARLRRHGKIPDGVDHRSVWTYLHGLDKRTGEVLWNEPAGTVCHNTPMMGHRKDGSPAIIHARGGGHGPLEVPYGISLTSLAAGREGKQIWSIDVPGLDPSFNSHWDAAECVRVSRTGPCRLLFTERQRKITPESP